MSDAVRKYHEEESIGKTYDFRVARRLFRYLKPYWKLAAAALFLTLLTNVLISTQPYFTKMAVDDFITPKRVDGIWMFALAFFGVFLLRFIFSYTQEVLLNNVGQRVMFDLRTELFTKLQRQEVAYYDHYPVGRTMTRLTSDVDALNELFTSGVIDVLGDLVVIFAIIGIMFWLDWKLALVSLVTVPLLFTATNWFRKHARNGFDRVRTRNARLNAFLQEYISGAQTVQLFNAEKKAQKRFRRDQRRLSQREYRDDLLLRRVLSAGRFYRRGRDRCCHFCVRLRIPVGHRRDRAGADCRNIGVIHSVLAAAFSAYPRPVGQVQRAAGGDRRIASNIHPARPRRRDHDPAEPKKMARRAARSNFKTYGSPTMKRTGC
jgi:ABC-type multidrug transport system fused ATPase/permease subunit